MAREMTKPRTTPIWAFVVLVVAFESAHPAIAQRREPVPSELTWIGLFNTELLEWLENENRLTQLCREPNESIEWHLCRSAKLEPKIAVIPVRTSPREDAPRIGELVIVALPGRGLRMFASAGGASTNFNPDMLEGDWVARQAILARHDTWYRVRLPLNSTGWIDARSWTDKPDERTVEANDIITTPRGDMVVLGVGEGVLRVRAEQDADMSICEGEQRQPKPWTEIALPFAELFAADGRLLIALKYTRGC